MALTRPRAEMILSTGTDDQTDLTVEGGRLKATNPIAGNVSEITEITYDDIQGILRILMSNGEQKVVKGFPTPTTLKPGLKGEQGKTGDPGADGQDGRDGNIGPQGPQGDQGERGPQGLPGVDGADGQKGIEGDEGPMGPSGPTGPTGPTGPQGPPGEIGSPGPDGATGAKGPQGDPGNINVIISTIDPGASAGAGAIWVNPGANSNVNDPNADPGDPDPGSIVWP